MTRLLAALCVLVLWAGIYLPSLGITEIKGEEGRRIFPALAMLESGNWLVPQLAGEPYLRKPPLMNWAIALSMRATGRRDEWAARLPSAAGVLALGLVTVFATASWLGAAGATMAGLFAISCIGLIEKGRLAEIEGLYVALTGMAMIWWMRGFRLQANRWVTWLGCGALLGLGLLTKGPLHLLFFYAMVVAVCARARSGREFFNLPHLAGALLALSIFAAWMIPYLAATRSGAAAATWQEQLVSRITHNQFDLESWLLAIPRGLGNFLPWVVLLPLLWRNSAARTLAPREVALLRGSRDALAPLFLGMLLIPGVLARYTLPALPAFGVLLALVLRDGLPARWEAGWRFTLRIMTGALGVCALAVPLVGGLSLPGLLASAGGLILCALVWRMSRVAADALVLSLATGVLMVVVTFVYAASVVPRMLVRDDLRPVGPAIAAQIPRGQVLHAVDVNYQPELFYLRTPIRYHARWETVPARAEWFLVRSKKRRDTLDAQPDLRPVAEFAVKLDKPLLLLRRDR